MLLPLLLLLLPPLRPPALLCLVQQTPEAVQLQQHLLPLLLLAPQQTVC
jgi:hypothetical protein